MCGSAVPESSHPLGKDGPAPRSIPEVSRDGVQLIEGQISTSMSPEDKPDCDVEVPSPDADALRAVSMRPMPEDCQGPIFQVGSNTLVLWWKALVFVYVEESVDVLWLSKHLIRDM